MDTKTVIRKEEKKINDYIIRKIRRSQIKGFWDGVRMNMYKLIIITITSVSFMVVGCETKKKTSKRPITYQTEKPKTIDKKEKLTGCQEYVVLQPAKVWANELGKSELWVLSNWKINVWEKPTSQGKGRVVGKMIPGSHSLILEIQGGDYKIKSPLDKSIGWISEVQVSSITKKNVETLEMCD